MEPTPDTACFALGAKVVTLDHVRACTECRWPIRDQMIATGKLTASRFESDDGDAIARDLESGASHRNAAYLAPLTDGAA